MENRRVAILGGRFGKHHAKGYKAAGCEVTAVLNESIENAVRDSDYINKTYGFKSKPYSNLSELLIREHQQQEDKLWGASVALPKHKHRSYGFILSQNNINMLIEKPNFESVEDYLWTAYHARKNNVLLASQNQWACSVSELEKFFDPEKLNSFKNFKYISVNSGRLRNKELFIDMIDHPVSILTEIAGVRKRIEKKSVSFNDGEVSVKFRYVVPEGSINCETVFVHDKSVKPHEKYTEISFDEDSIKHKPIYVDGKFSYEVFETIDGSQSKSPDFLKKSVKRFGQGKPIVDYIKGLNTVSVRERLLMDLQ